MSNATGRQVSLFHLLIYALPVVSLGIMTAPVFYVIPTYYAQHTSMALGAMGTILIVTRLFDAFADPAVGYLSDRTVSQFGARKPWIAAGSVVLALSLFKLFTPSESDGAGYFLIWSLVFYLGWTMFELPYSAWLSEMSRDYKERARIGAWLGVASQAGGFIFFAASASGIFKTTSMDAGVLYPMAWVCAISLPLFTLIAVAVVPHGKKIVAEKPNWRHLWTAIRGNRPLQIFVASQLLGGMGGGIMLGTQLFMLDSYFHIADKFGLIFVVYGATHFIGMPIWLRIVYRIGKHRAWATSWALGAALGPLVLLFPTGAAALPWMLGFTAFRSLVSGADIVVPKALMADAVDYGILKTGSNAAGSYYAIWALGVKMCAAISSGIAFYLLDAFGFNPKPGAVNTEIGINGLLFVSLFLPAVFNIAAAYCIWHFPIGSKRADIIRKRIEARGLRAGMVLAD